MEMKFTTTPPHTQMSITDVYQSPKCDIYDVESEGVLCSSIEDPEDIIY